MFEYLWWLPQLTDESVGVLGWADATQVCSSVAGCRDDAAMLLCLGPRRRKSGRGQAVSAVCLCEIDQQQCLLVLFNVHTV